MSLDGAPPPYASTRLIAYLGNKRALLPFLKGLFLELDGRFPVGSFLDPFAGSGAATRLARCLGWRVAASDAEDYSRVVNEAWLGVSADELPSLFRSEGGVDGAFARLNRLHPEREGEDFPGEPYIARHYAPERTAAADYRRERLFYTAENAVFLDRARYAIESLRPASSAAPRSAAAPGGAAAKERALLLGALVYEAATHANTSGVFKACHKGFGGHGRDALGRILSPMALEPPLLWPGPPAEVGQGDAAAFCASHPAGLCYLDPPYNQHQYGSNYHLLNAIARWDRPPVSEERRADGSLESKAGIDPGWARTRSDFCSRAGAKPAFERLLASIDARFVVLSYNTEGFVPPEELHELLAERAEVTLRSRGYVKYRGGRQSADRLQRTGEILFVAERREGHGRPGRGALEAPARGGASSAATAPAATAPAATAPAAEAASAGAGLRRLNARLRLGKALAGPFLPEALGDFAEGDFAEGDFAEGDFAEGDFAEGEVGIIFESSAGRLLLPAYRLLLLEPGAAEACAELSVEDMEALAARLEPALARDNAAAVAAAARLIAGGACDSRIQRLALSWLRKLAHRKYERDYRALSGELAALARARPDELKRLAEGLEATDALLEARLSG